MLNIKFYKSLAMATHPLFLLNMLLDLNPEAREFGFGVGFEPRTHGDITILRLTGP